MENRAMRRAKKSAFKRQLRTAVFDEFKNSTSIAKNNEGFQRIKIGNLVGFYQNSMYSVQIYERKKSRLLGIRRHDQVPSCPWSHKQMIKNKFFGPDVSAIEVFPKVQELTDDANMYWLWASKDIDDLVQSLGGLKEDI